EALDRERLRLFADGGDWPVDAAGAVEPDREVDAFEAHIGGAPLAARQRAELELDAEPAGLHRAGVARPGHFELPQHQRRRRQEPQLYRALGAYLQADQRARIGLELGAIAVPIDKMRADQRRGQRQDDRNRQTKQRRLHAVSKAGCSSSLAPRGGTPAPKTNQQLQLSTNGAAGPCSPGLASLRPLARGFAPSLARN